VDYQWLTSLISQIALTLVSIAGTVFLLYLKKKYANDALVQEMIECINVGVTDTYNNFVRDTKAKNANNKLTEEERMLARNLAISVAKDIASKKVFMILDKMDSKELECIVDQIVNKLKK